MIFNRLFAKFKLFFLFILIFLFVIVFYSTFLTTKHTDSIYRLDINKIESTVNKPVCDCRKNDKIKLVKDEENIQVITNVKNYTLSNNELLNSKMGCDPHNVLRRGPGQKVISYSVFGTNPFYFRYLELISKTASKIYPEWIVRFYHDDTFDKNLICKLECENKNVDFCNVHKIPFAEFFPEFIIPTFWRWFPIGDTFVDVFLSRDSDFCVVERDRDAVDEWLSLNTLFHVMRDHPLHSINILAGMWGFAMNKNRELAHKIFSIIFDPLLSNWHKVYRTEKQADQMFLKNFLWDIIKHNVTAHDSYHCSKLGGRPFPTQRPILYCHLGGYGCCGPEYSNSSFPHECPYECRPKQHIEWVFC